MLPKGSGFNVAEGVVGKLESWTVGQGSGGFVPDGEG